MVDKRGILVLGEAVSEEPEDAIPIGNEAFVTDHVSNIKQKLLDDLIKLEHLPHKLIKGEAGFHGTIIDKDVANYFQEPASRARHRWII